MADSLANSPARDRFWSRACRARHPVWLGVSELSQVRILLRPLATPQLGKPRWCPILGAKRERPAPRICGQLRPTAVILTVHRALTSTYILHQVRYSNVFVVRDEEAAGPNSAISIIKAVFRMVFGDMRFAFRLSRVQF
jgi:hypothetical protein